MSANVSGRRPAKDLRDLRAALEYKAPFLLEKLVKDRIVNETSEGEALFTEVKRYLVLTHVDHRDVAWEMYSRRVDEVWHQFILFTREYSDFCDKYFGGFVHHRPSNAPVTSPNRSLRSSSFPAFSARYREVFGHELPECWTDSKSITPDRRLISNEADRLVVSEDWGRASLIHEDGTVLFSVDSIALEALAFVANTPAFYVRELPGDLTNEERSAIAEALLGQRLLRIAS